MVFQKNKYMVVSVSFVSIAALTEKLEDINGIIRSRKSNKDRLYNGQKEKDKQTKHTIENYSLRPPTTTGEHKCKMKWYTKQNSQ